MTPAPLPPYGNNRHRSIRRRLSITMATVAAALLAVPAAAAALPVPHEAAASVTAAAPPTLNQLAAAKGRYFASATDNPELSDAPYTAVLGSEFGVITPGNSMKWDTTEPTRGQFSFAKGDAVVSFAQAHGEDVRGHTLVWHSQLPGWVSALPASEVRSAMESHIAGEAGHYKGQVKAWDVVNEPFNDDGTYRTSPFYNAMGKDFITYALQAARAADPAAKLYINDYNTDGTGAKSDAMYNLVRDLKAAGVPIDGVGFQAHLATQYGFPSQMQQNLQRFADLGVDVAITELDVRMVLPADATKLAAQSTYYRQVTEACLAVSRCVGITIWDYTDKYSWVPGAFSGQGSACLWDSNLQPKAVLDVVRTALGYTGGGGTGDTQAPTVPAGLTVTGATSSSVSLSWTAATDNTGVTGYDVFRGGTQVGSSTATTFTSTGLTASTAYSFTVRAKDAAGNVSAQSTAVTGTTQAGGGTGGGTLKVQYKNNDSSAGDNQIRPWLQLVNTGSGAVGLSSVKVRYWFSGEAGASTYSTACDYAVIGCGSVTQSVSASGSSTPGADHYLEVGFSSGSLAAGASTGELQLRFNKTDWSNFSETDDYSRGTNTTFADAAKIAVYVGGTLVWGTAP
ncbi:endo-1,4-beta-xylanase [Streptomyces beijiangensis]|uniref:Beta-xylanase n=1 Tax=Streptomyces beijiangensis TaxID=163361 RepID=A0A939JFY5_9ACTN|nr:endo-1,4-beta-xylanase [Streptomyces beijiangensis]MBO0510530.1 endo-1,4-beta-xylanase [Streptomyces beijiangensis]